MTRGQCGSLPPHRDGLAPSTSCRSPGAPWLNPTPHAIAVYASQPLLPVATQHSLPSGSYPYLGRTSTGWIAPACGSITSSANASTLAGTLNPTSRRRLEIANDPEPVGSLSRFIPRLCPHTRFLS